MNYIRYVIESNGVDIAKKAKAFSIYTCASAGIIAIMLAFKMIFNLDNSRMVNLPGYYLLAGLLTFGYMYYFSIVFSIANKISKRILIILMGYILLPIIVTGTMHIFLPECIFSFAVMDITLVMIYIMLQSNIQDASEQEKLEYFQSMAAIYHSLYVFDLEKDTFLEFGTEKYVHEYVKKNKELSLQEIMWGIMTLKICEAHRGAVKEFTDFSTLEERMKENNMISIEVINVDKKWLRFSFIRIRKEKYGLKKVFFTSLDINDYKRKENELILMSNTDQLTHLYNRNAYETYIKEVEEKGVPDDLIYVSCDLNGLKISNDTFGHDAGDELIIKMAECLTKSFASHGKVYRIGGDEFAVILQGSMEEYKKKFTKFKLLQTNWHGIFVDELSCSLGMVRAKEVADGTIIDIRKLADERMYECKRAYYKLKGINRLGQKINVE